MITAADPKKNPAIGSSPVHVAVCFDENMALPFLVLAESLRNSIKNKGRKVIIHAIHRATLHNDTYKITSGNSDNFVVNFIHADYTFTNLPKNIFVTDAMYLRLYLHEILCNIDKVLYLDVDTIVVKDVSTLYDMELNGCCLAASVDRGLTVICKALDLKMDEKRGPNPIYGENVSTYICNTTGLKNGYEDIYFNSGVMLVDLKLWRKLNICDSAIEFLSRNHNSVYPDQDALNALLATKYIQLDDRWNSLAICATRYNFIHGSVEARRIIYKWRCDPWIVHYAGANKPWRADRDSTPLDFYFWNAANKSFAYPLLKQMYNKSKPLMTNSKLTKKFPSTPAQYLMEVSRSLVDRLIFSIYSKG